MEPEHSNELIKRFSSWLKILVKRAKIDYLRRISKLKTELSLEELSGVQRLSCDFKPLENEENFEFESKSLDLAFSALRNREKQVLTMLYLKNLSPDKVARELGCTLENVYNTKSIAFKKIKERFKKE